MKIRFLASAFKNEGWCRFGDEILNHRILHDEWAEMDTEAYEALALLLLNWQIDNGDYLWHLVERQNSLSFPMRLEYSDWDAVLDRMQIPCGCRDCLRSIRNDGMVPMLSVWCEGYEENYYERMMLQDAEERLAQES